MQTSAELKNLLQRIDHKGYPAYKDTRGSYEFPGYVLSSLSNHSVSCLSLFKKNTVQEKTWFSTVYFLNGNFY